MRLGRPGQGQKLIERAQIERAVLDLDHDAADPHELGNFQISELGLGHP